MMRSLALLLGLVLLIAAGTAFVGWWTVPIVAGVWTLAFPRRGAVLYAAFAGALAWGALLLQASRSGPIGQLDALLSGVMSLPPRFPLLLTLSYAALLAGAAALIAQAIRPPKSPAERRATASSPSRSG
jgi:hypothetical protein